MSTSEELGAFLSTGDRDLFNDLYKRYWEKLFNVANKHLKDAVAAEDVVHDVFLSLWNNRKKVAINQFENYLVTAVKYQVLTQIRKKAYARKYTRDAAIADPPELVPEISNAVHNRKILELVYKEIDLLPEKCKLIFQYSREEGMTSKEIAQILKISKKTVDNQIHKALERLKFRLKHMLFTFLG
ncbi:RNA polymerase sigma-70 factor [Chitinophaga sp. 212800010-3]|uniref:RNA polymerase sigma factor n=1 Tax=unclassified Chitinophaga TaxID=2619133 RepID=UPI002DE94316|nr:RNA polymerase sigma-70 factor, ECF subfamily [Chitinophaga sp. 212800010-3]